MGALVFVGSIGDFADRAVTIKDVDGRSIGIFRDGREFSAFLNVCPHRGAPVCRGEVGGVMAPSQPDEFVFEARRNVLRCPWHRWAFDVSDGSALFGVDSRKLSMFRVRLEGDDVYVEPARSNGRQVVSAT